jgi:hypothetical protein
MEIDLGGEIYVPRHVVTKLFRGYPLIAEITARPYRDGAAFFATRMLLNDHEFVETHLD